MRRFDARALYAAMDDERRRRGVTWEQVAAETRVARATLVRTRDGGRLEVDGMLAMVGWLGRRVEEFVVEVST